MYTTVNFKTKKALKEAVADGREVEIYQPGPFGSSPGLLEIADGEYSVEGPHYPEPHKWYARVTIKNGIVVKVT